MPFFQPDRYFSRITRIDIESDLLGRGFDHVLLDMDNTLLPRDTHQVPRDIESWLNDVRAADISLCLLSNNFHHGVYEWADRLDLPIVAKAVKPLPHGFLAAKHKIGGTRSDTVMIGDQLMTDVVGAHLCGMKAYMVMPLVDVDLWHTLLLRNVERAFMGSRLPEGARQSVAPSASATTPEKGRTT